jgi:hypothetical protein
MNPMRYPMHDDISFCRLEGGLIFLDIQRDQYFRLSSELERAFVDYWQGDGCATSDVGGLVKRNILTPSTTWTVRSWAPAVDAPNRSAFESFPLEKKLRTTEILEVLGIVCSTRFQLRLRSLREVLNSLIAYRRTRAPRQIPTPAEPSLQHLRDVTSIFRRARLYVPIEPCCLLDSLALARFLAHHNLHADIVFGVTGDPFSAHCWLQVGTLVLNDSVGNVDTYTPIRVI